MDDRVSQSFYQTIFEHGLDAVVLSDPQGNIYATNPAACELFGRSEQELCAIGRAGLIGDKPSPQLERFLEERARTGKIRTELSFVRADGDAFVGEVGSTQFINEVGETRTVLTIRDVTQHRQAQTALAESEEKYRSVVNAMGEGLVLEDNEGRIIDANPAAEIILGRKADEMIGMTSYDESWHAIHEDEEPFLGNDHPITIALRSGNPQRDVVMGIQQPHGSLRWLSINSESILDSKTGKPKTAVVTFHDITERRKAEHVIAEYAKRLENSVYQTLTAIASMIDMRDPYTAGHQRRVAAIARDIAHEMGWTDEHCRNLEQTCLIHDIGKISIPAEILTKPTHLSPTEYQMIQTHVEKGYQILKDIDFPFPVAEIVYQHHERLDGSGYPRGLKANEILPEACVLAVADVVEAMTSHRPYRPSLGTDAALEEIRKNRGTLYDPVVSDALVRILNQKDYQLPQIEQ